MTGSELVDENVLLLGPGVCQPAGLVTARYPDQFVSQHVTVQELARGVGVLGALHLETELQRVPVTPSLWAPLGAGVGELPGVRSEGNKAQPVGQHLILHDTRILTKSAVLTLLNSKLLPATCVFFQWPWMEHLTRGFF